MPQDPISAAHAREFAPDQIAPAELKLRRSEQQLRIKWKDGRESVYSAVRLRKHCPCASCRTEREKQSRELLPILKQAPPSSVMLTSAQLVGSYAIQLFWSDGHDTGIFDFKYLRVLDETAPK